MEKTHIDRNDYSNTSAHTSISAYINCAPAQRKSSQEKTQRIQKILWESGNIPKYQEKLAEQLKQVNQPVVNIDLAIQQVTQIIKQSVRAAFPVKTVKLKGPKLKISQTTLSLVKESKQILNAWREAGSPRGDHPLFKHKKKLKRLIRKQNRQERAIDKRRFFTKLMANPDTSYFYKLIKRNTGKAKSHVQTTIVTGKKEEI